MATHKKPSHSWKFFRAGGFDQVRLDSSADLAHLDQLDQKLWVALACPIAGLEFDAKTLALVDTDKDGRIRAPELIAAAKWLVANLKNPDDALRGAPTLPLAAINDATPDGKQLLSSARQILTNLGKPEAAEVTLEDTADTARIFAQTRFNGDGIIPADAADDDATRALIGEVMDCLGSEPDRSGKPGVSQARVDDFFAQLQALSDWWKRAESEKSIVPLGEATAAASAAVKAVKAKVDDYFLRCRLAAFDSAAAAPMNAGEARYAAIAPKDLTVSMAEIAALPLAHVEAGKPLPLTEGLNPAWADAMGTLRTAAVAPLVGDKTVLSESDWAAIQAELEPFETWSASKAGANVEKLGLKRVREILSGKGKDVVAALIAKDKALEPEANSIAAVDQLIHYHRDLYRLCTNFVNFQHFYQHSEPAIFQAGTLYLDQRSCEFTLPVQDAARHAALAGLAGAYLAYCDCSRKGSGETRQIVAAFTDGDSDNLMVGRNGIFYDRQGRDWDATITKIIDNPISIREAFWSPYKKLVRFIEAQVAKRATAGDAAASSRLETAATNVTTVDQTKAAAAAPPKKVDVGTVAAIGVACGAIGTAVATLWAGAVGLVNSAGVLAVLGIVIGLLVLISGPSVILAYIKLRKRNLGPILDANGWAVNAKAKINVPFAKTLTQVAKLPPGASRGTVDPFADKKNPWVVLFVTLLSLWIIWRILVVTGVTALIFGNSGRTASGAANGGTNAPAASGVMTTNVPIEKK